MSDTPKLPQSVVLTAQGLSCERDERLLFEAVGFELKSGQALRIGGANGSGKTTLLRGLVGLNIYLEGQFQWLVADRTPFLYMGHRPGISGHLTVLENLLFLAASHGLSPTDDALLQALTAVELDRFDDSLGNQLSAGQQRRVMLALLHLPDVPLCWVLDEPFTALDRQGVARLETHLANHCSQGGSVLFSTHHEPDSLPYRTLWLGPEAAYADAELDGLVEVRA